MGLMRSEVTLLESISERSNVIVPRKDNPATWTAGKTPFSSVNDVIVPTKKYVVAVAGAAMAAANAAAHPIIAL
jgi:hypothetical protein